MDPLIVERAVVIDYLCDSDDAAPFKSVGPVIEDGNGLFPGGFGHARVAGGGIAAANDPEILAVEGEVGFEAMIPAQEIEGGGSDEELHVAGGDHGAVGSAGVE